MKRIFVSKKERNIIMKKFGVTKSTLTKALNFSQNSLLNKELRSYAMNFAGGTLFDNS